MNEYPRPAVDDARLPDLILPLAFREATPAARRLQRRATAALLGASAVVGLYVLARALGAVAGGLDVVLGVGVPLCAAAATWLVRLRLGRVAARVWTPLAAGTTLWALAIAIGAMPRPESSSRVLGTLLIFAAFGCWIFALAGLQQHTYLGSRLPHLIDALLVLVGGLTLAVHFVLGPILDGGIEPTQLLLRTGANLVLFILVIGFRYAAVGPLAPSVALMLTGILVLLLGDGQALWVAVGGHPHLPLLSGVAVMAAGLLFVGAAHRAVFPPTGPPRDRWEAFAPWLPLASLGAVLLLPTLRYTGQPISGLVLLGVLFAFALALVRLGISLNENNRLRREHSVLRQQNEHYVRMAISDPLTGLFNKGYFDYRLRAEFERSTRYDYPLALIALDLDNFKSVNDQFGHAAGDALLQAIGHAIQTCSRSVDVPCRCGGDEFMVILPHMSVEGGLVVAHRLRSVITGVLAEYNLHQQVSSSAGVAGYPGTAQREQELHAQADEALYQAKRAGKNRAVRWAPAGAVPPAPTPPAGDRELDFTGDAPPLAVH